MKKDVMYIYHAKTTSIPYEWYLSHRSGMSGFIIERSTMNKEVN